MAVFISYASIEHPSNTARRSTQTIKACHGGEGGIRTRGKHCGAGGLKFILVARSSDIPRFHHALPFDPEILQLTPRGQRRGQPDAYRPVNRKAQRLPPPWANDRGCGGRRDGSRGGRSRGSDSGKPRRTGLPRPEAPEAERSAPGGAAPRPSRVTLFPWTTIRSAPQPERSGTSYVLRPSRNPPKSSSCSAETTCASRSRPRSSMRHGSRASCSYPGSRARSRKASSPNRRLPPPRGIRAFPLRLPGLSFPHGSRPRGIPLRLLQEPALQGRPHRGRSRDEVQEVPPREHLRGERVGRLPLPRVPLPASRFAARTRQEAPIHTSVPGYPSVVVHSITEHKILCPSAGRPALSIEAREAHWPAGFLLSPFFSLCHPPRRRARPGPHRRWTSDPLSRSTSRDRIGASRRTRTRAIRSAA